MDKYKDQDQDRDNQSINSADKSGVEETLSSFEDNRPEALAQQELQSTMDSSPQSQEAEVYDDIINDGGKKKKVNKTGIPDDLKAKIEQESGYSLDEVRVHYNSDKPAEYNALAYAEGLNIYIGPGQEEHLAHEVWHVVQQMQGRVKATTKVNGANVNDKKSLEKDADKMGAKVSKSNQNLNEDKELKPTPNLTRAVMQGKFGVEYETKWTIDDPENVSANHKKPVYEGEGFHVESDNNDLEFVSFPPSDTPKKLFETVGKMKTLGEKMKGNLKGEVSEEEPKGPFFKDNAKSLLESMQQSTKIEDIIKHVVREEDLDLIKDSHISDFADKLVKDGWETTEEDESQRKKTKQALTDYEWSVGDIKDYITMDYLSDILKVKPAPKDPVWQKNNTIKDLLGEEPKAQFKDKSIIVESVEKTMRARPQFTFGIEMAKIPKLFDMFIKGPKVEGEDQNSLNYGRDEKQTLKDFGENTIGAGLKAGNDKAKAIFEENETGNLNDTSKGFIHYLTYYINQMRTKAYASKGLDVEKTRSTHIAQVLLNALKAEANEEYPVDKAKYKAGLKNIELTSNDKKDVEAAGVLDQSLASVLEAGKITKVQKGKLDTYLSTNLGKMKDDPVYPKHFFVLMNRSGFDRMYDALGGGGQKDLVNNYMENKVIPSFLKDEQDDISLFKAPFYYKQKTGDESYERGLSYGPSLKEWWKSIKSVDDRQDITGVGLEESQKKRDKLSPPKEFIDNTGKPDETQSLGSLNRMDGDMTVIELREWGSYMPVSDWQKHTSDMLKSFAVNVMEEEESPSFE